MPYNVKWRSTSFVLWFADASLMYLIFTQKLESKTYSVTVCAVSLQQLRRRRDTTSSPPTWTRFSSNGANYCFLVNIDIPISCLVRVCGGD